MKREFVPYGLLCVVFLLIGCPNQPLPDDPPSANADLSALTLNYGELVPPFSPGVTSYAVSVPYNLASIEIAGTSADPHAVVSAIPTQPMNLSMGANAVVIRVRAQDGVTTKDYAVTVTRLPSANANLGSLSLSSGSLIPAFSPEVTSYAVNVANGVTSMTLTGTSEDAGAAVSYAPSQTTALTVGANVLTVTVTAADGATVKHYAVTVNVAAPGAYWTGTTLPGAMQSIAYGDGVFVAVASGSDNRAYYSSDGITWQSATLPVITNWNSISYGEGTFVAVGIDCQYAAYSIDDGKTWTSSLLPSKSWWLSVAYGGGGFVAIAGGTSEAAYSSDGVTWQSTSLPQSPNWNDVAYGNGTFVVVAANTTVSAYSANGIDWDTAALPTSSKWARVTFGGDTFVAIASSGVSTAYSADGVNWQSSELPANADWADVTWGKDTFIAVAYSSATAAYSSDGIDWGSSALPSSAYWNSAAFGNGIFVAVARVDAIGAYSP